MKLPLVLTGVLVTVCQTTGRERLEVVLRTKPTALFVQDKSTKPAGCRFKFRLGMGRTVTQAENSDVLFALSVAVAVTTKPSGTDTGSVVMKPALQEASVLTARSPR